MLMVALAVMMSVIVTNIYSKKDYPGRAPRCCVALLTRLCPTGTGNTTACCGVEKESSNGTEETAIAGGDGPGTVDDAVAYSEEWVLLAKSADRLCFWVYFVLTLTLIVALVTQVV